MIEWVAFGLRLAEPVLKAIGGSLYDRYLKYKIRRDIRLGTGTKIAIIIARLAGDDEHNSCRTTLYETIRSELGDAIELTTWPEEFALGEGYESDAEHGVHAKAQQLLTTRNADLLISGRLKGHAEGKPVLSLRFAITESKAPNPESYTLTETFDMPVDFMGRLGAAIAARVVMNAAPAVDMAGQYLVPLMQATAERLEPIVTTLNPNFDSDTRASLFFSYALVSAAIGEQSGSNEALFQAVAAYRAASWRSGRASACRSTGPRPRTISALRLRPSASARAARRGWRRRSPPIAPR